MVSSVAGSRKTNSAQPAVTVDKIQTYGSLITSIVNAHFLHIKGIPDIKYIILAIMELESGFRVWHNNNTSPLHKPINEFTSSLGKAYWFDKVIRPLHSASPEIIANLRHGLHAMALMGTMGLYQVRNTHESKVIINSDPKYSQVASTFSLLVEPGQSIAAVFPNDDTGAQRSIAMGCMIFEYKYRIFFRHNSPDIALRKTVGAYLGEVGKADRNGTTPEARISHVFNGTDARGRALMAANIFSPGTVFGRPSAPSQVRVGKLAGTVETKQTTVASTNNTRDNTNGCGTTKA